MKPPVPLTELVPRLSLRPKEAAAALGISERRLRQLLPELPHVRRRGVLLFPVDALRAWLEKQSAPPSEASAPRTPADGNAAAALAKSVLEDLGR